MNHTTNYNLPLYTATDETNYMTNWNQSMTTIDGAIKDVDDKPVVDQTARDAANTANNSIENMLFSTPTNHNISGTSFTVPKDGVYSFYATITKAGKVLTVFSAVINGITIASSSNEASGTLTLYLNSILLKGGVVVNFIGQEGQVVSNLVAIY